jgi:hypothetical protein
MRVHRSLSSAARQGLRSRRQPAALGHNRQGMALGLALVFVLAMGALATGAIVLGSNASMVAKAVDRQKEFKYAAQAGVEIGKSLLNYSPTLMPDSGQTQIMSNYAIKAADNTPLPNMHVNVWVGPTGSTTGQFGIFASVVAQAFDTRSTGAVRRLELTQESFAQFAYWSNLETNSGTTIYFNNGDQLWGPVWSNDVIHIGTGGATFHNTVSTAKTISGISYGTFMKGYMQNQKVINLPSTSALSKLSGYASAAGYNFTAPTSGDETTVLDRLEFVDAQLTAVGDSLEVQDGFFRVYQANTGNQAWLRGDFPSSPTASNVKNCGDWHWVLNSSGVAEARFFPASVHNNSWFQTADSAGLRTVSGGSISASNAHTYAAADKIASLSTIMNGHPNHTTPAPARCYLGGDPHLVAIDRNGAAGYAAATYQIGGTDTTFTPTGSQGAWKLYSNSPDTSVSNHRPYDAKYLFPLYRGLNPSTKGVIYFAGTVGVSGTLRGRVTVYAHSGDIVILDETRYANDPALGTCADVLGLITDNDIPVADNALNTPQQPGSGSYLVMRPTTGLYLDAVMMALNTSFRVQNYDQAPGTSQISITCQGNTSSHGCLYMNGGVIQVSRGAVGTTGGSNGTTGYVKAYSYDRCAATNPPPYFPTTGRFTDNRYFEINPVGFSAPSLYQSLTPK